MHQKTCFRLHKLLEVIVHVFVVVVVISAIKQLLSNEGFVILQLFVLFCFTLHQLFTIILQIK